MTSGMAIGKMIRNNETKKDGGSIDKECICEHCQSRIESQNKARQQRSQDPFSQRRPFAHLWREIPASDLNIKMAASSSSMLCMDQYLSC